MLIFFTIFSFSFFFNFFWEAIHAVYLYQRHDINASNYVPMLGYVSSMDSIIILGIYFSVCAMWLDLYWINTFSKTQVTAFMAIGILTAGIIEILSVFYLHRWEYKQLMPTIFGIGLSPLVQLSVTGFLAVWLTKVLMYGTGLLRGSSCQ